MWRWSILAWGAPGGYRGRVGRQLLRRAGQRRAVAGGARHPAHLPHRSGRPFGASRSARPSMAVTSSPRPRGGWPLVPPSGMPGRRWSDGRACAPRPSGALASSKGRSSTWTRSATSSPRCRPTVEAGGADARSRSTAAAASIRRSGGRSPTSSRARSSPTSAAAASWRSPVATARPRAGGRRAGDGRSGEDERAMTSFIWSATAACAALLAIGIVGASSGCTVGSGSGYANGPVWVTGCMPDHDYGTPTMPEYYQLAPTFFAGDPWRRPPSLPRTSSAFACSGMARPPNTTTCSPSTSRTRTRSLAVSGSIDPMTGAEDWDHLGLNLGPWCDWTGTGFASDGGVSDGGTSTGGTPGRPRIRVTSQGYVQASLALLYTCPINLLQTSGPALDGHSVDGWIEFTDFGNAAHDAALRKSDDSGRLHAHRCRDLLRGHRPRLRRLSRRRQSDSAEQQPRDRRRFRNRYRGLELMERRHAGRQQRPGAHRQPESARDEPPQCQSVRRLQPHGQSADQHHLQRERVGPDQRNRQRHRAAGVESGVRRRRDTYPWMQNNTAVVPGTWTQLRRATWSSRRAARPPTSRSSSKGRIPPTTCSSTTCRSRPFTGCLLPSLR